jgi:hypothetical protein
MPDRITVALDACRPQIEEALAHGGDTHDFDDLSNLIRTGHAQLWLDEEGPGSCIVTEVLDHPRYREVRCWIVAGRLDRVVPISERVAAWAREIGASKLTGVGRDGWVRALRHHGWRKACVTVVKELHGGR